MAIKYLNIFQTKAHQNNPNWDFWFVNKPSGNPAAFKFCRWKKTPRNAEVERDVLLFWKRDEQGDQIGRYFATWENYIYT
jgi:hypothetical protein